jgi:hypothetical protein
VQCNDIKGESCIPLHAPSTTISSAVSTLEDAKSKVTDSESEYFFVWSLNFTFLHKADETHSIKFIMPCLYGLLLLQRSLLPGGIILQGALLLQGSMSIFACHYG